MRSFISTIVIVDRSYLFRDGVVNAVSRNERRERHRCPSRRSILPLLPCRLRLLSRSRCGRRLRLLGGLRRDVVVLVLLFRRFVVRRFEFLDLHADHLAGVELDPDLVFLVENLDHRAGDLLAARRHRNAETGCELHLAVLVVFGSLFFLGFFFVFRLLLGLALVVGLFVLLFGFSLFLVRLFFLLVRR